MDYNALGKSTPLPWTAELLKLKASVEATAGISFNSAAKLLPGWTGFDCLA